VHEERHSDAKETEPDINIAALTHEKLICFSNKDNMPTVIDSGASSSWTPNLDAFVGDLKEAHMKDPNGLSSKTNVVGVGKVRWTICDLFGVTWHVETTACCAPQATSHTVVQSTVLLSGDRIWQMRDHGGEVSFDFV
jgi:hypothetical protein